MRLIKTGEGLLMNILDFFEQCDVNKMVLPDFHRIIPNENEEDIFDWKHLNF